MYFRIKKSSPRTIDRKSVYLSCRAIFGVGSSMGNSDRGITIWRGDSPVMLTAGSQRGQSPLPRQQFAKLRFGAVQTFSERAPREV